MGERAESPRETERESCREYLGARKGYCPAAGTIPDRTHRLFCGHHAIQRKLTTKP